MKSTNGKPSGFDYMRLTLAALVICFHSIVTSYGVEAQNQFNQTFSGKAFGMILPMFFCLSGFLVAGSLMRSRSVTTFIGLRALRIYPALAIDTIFFGLIIGPILTTLPLSDYFSNPTVHNYLLNAVGIIHYYLPGVFENNPSKSVNGQLWTIQYEMECYIS
ncbi:MAG TPA: acyltransferase, partial [Aquabacterium sp.]|nr:acyltransferase [Aquabacterium sp.]